MIAGEGEPAAGRICIGLCTERGEGIRRLSRAITCVALLTMAGCESKTGTAALSGAVGAGAGGYELHLRRPMSRVEDDFKVGRIDQKEHELRTDQVKPDSLLQ